MVNTKATRAVIGLILLPAAIISMIIGVRHAILYRTHDFQWCGSLLIRLHVDPWAEELAHFPHHYAHFVTPNYLHVLYVLFLPLSWLSFDSAALLWTAISILLSIACVISLAKLFGLTVGQAVFAGCVLWMSSPFRVVLEVGQVSFFELFFLVGAYIASSEAVRGASFGISLAKYSFSPVATTLFLFRRRLPLLLYALSVPTIGLVIVWLLLNTPLKTLALEPFAVSSGATAVSAGYADVMTLVEQLLKSPLGDLRARQLAYGLGLAGSFTYALCLSRVRLSRSAELALVSVASLFFLKHLTYDYIFLLVPLCFGLAQQKRIHKVGLVGGVLIFWFVLTILDRRFQNDAIPHVGVLWTNCLLLTLYLAYVTWLAIKSALPAANGEHQSA